MQEYIDLLKLNRHIEGGYFGEFYKSSDKVSYFHPRYKDPSSESLEPIQRNAGSSIYFLLDKEDFSAWHILKSDEIWHYYDGGSPINIYILNDEGKLETHLLGNPSIIPEASFQVLIKAGLYFAAELVNKTTYALVGCTVNPGFEYQDFTLAQQKELIEKYPEHKNIIIRLTRTEEINPSNIRSTIDSIKFKKNDFSSDNYIKLLKLNRHIEGGYFGEFYKSSDKVFPLHPRYKDPSSESLEPIQRNAGSSIYFLLDKEDFSAWHILKSDEIWHYYDGGSPINIYILNDEGKLETHLLGNPSIIPGASFQVLIKAGLYFAAELVNKTTYALVGCTVNPGFEYQDFTLAQQKELIEKYPEHNSIIARLSYDTPKNPSKIIPTLQNYNFLGNIKEPASSPAISLNSPVGVSIQKKS